MIYGGLPACSPPAVACERSELLQSSCCWWADAGWRAKVHVRCPEVAEVRETVITIAHCHTSAYVQIEQRDKLSKTWIYLRSSDNCIFSCQKSHFSHRNKTKDEKRCQSTDVLTHNRTCPHTHTHRVKEEEIMRQRRRERFIDWVKRESLSVSK